MRRRWRWGAIATAGLLLIPLAATAEVTQSDLVLVREGETVSEDLIAAGNRIRVDGVIEGDLVAAAFDEILITGEVTGDLLAISGSVRVEGSVGGSVRALSGRVTILGSVGDDVAVAAWNLSTDTAATIGRDLIVFGRNATVAGQLERDVSGRFSRLDLAAAVAGSVEVSVGQLTILSTADVSGDLGYRSSREAVIESATETDPVRRFPLPANVRVRALRVLTIGLVWLMLLAAGLLSIHFWPERLERATSGARKWVPSWLSGLGVLLSPIVVLGFLGLLLSLTPTEAGLPLAVVFIPIAVGLFGVILLGAMAGAIPVAAALGRTIRSRLSLPGGFVLGMLALLVLMVVPFLGWLLLIGVVPLGLGAWLAPRT